MRTEVFENKSKSPEVGERRRVFKFLWLPLTLPTANRLEKRWLEISEIEQTYNCIGMYLTDGGGSPVYGWKDDRFIN